MGHLHQVSSINLCVLVWQKKAPFRVYVPSLLLLFLFIIIDSRRGLPNAVPLVNKILSTKNRNLGQMSQII
jgi:hypothetical protein